MRIQTTRFGIVQAEKSDIVTFREGLIGFANLRQFILLDDPADEIFAWLQSCEVPEIAFPILEPELFMQGYKVRLTRNEKEALGDAPEEKLRIFSIVTIPSDVTEMTANLKAPVMINVKERLARQVVAQENEYPIRFPIFSELKKRLSSNTSLDVKQGVIDWGVAITVPGAPAPAEGPTADR